jgi:hypothetical protein
MADPENLEFAATEAGEQFSRHVIARIRAKDALDRESRPVLINFVMRMPLETRDRLREVARLHRTTMTAIVLCSLERILPTLESLPPRR